MGSVFPLWSLAERERARKAAAGVILAQASRQISASLIGHQLTDQDVKRIGSQEQEGQVGAALIDLGVGALRGEVGTNVVRGIGRGRVGRYLWGGVAFTDGTSADFNLRFPIVGADLRDDYKNGAALNDALAVNDVVTIGDAAALSYHSWSEEIWGWPLAHWLRLMAEGRRLRRPPPEFERQLAAFAGASPSVLTQTRRDDALERARAQPKALP